MSLFGPRKHHIEVPVHIKDSVDAASKVRAIVVEAESPEEAQRIVAEFARVIGGKNIKSYGP